MIALASERSPIDRGDRVGILRDGSLLGEWCGDHWCRACDVPAAYVDVDGQRYFLRGSMTASGAVMQRVQQHRDGALVDLRTILAEDEIAWLMRRWWG